VQPHWTVVGDAAGKWSVTMLLTASTALAEGRMQSGVAEAAAS
jgi:hypothetical protein